MRFKTHEEQLEEIAKREARAQAAKDKKREELRHVYLTLHFKYGVKLRKNQAALIQEEIDRGYP